MSLTHGIHMLKYGKHDEAIGYFLDCLYDDPLNLEAIKYAGIGFTEAGRQDEAIRALEFYTARVSGSSEAWEGLGCAYYRVKRFEDAKMSFTRAMEITPDESSVIRNLGLTCMVLQDEQMAYELLERAVSMDCKDFRSVYALSSLCIRIRKFDEAESLLKGIKDEAFLPADLKDLIQNDYKKVKSMLQWSNGFTQKA